MSISKNAEGVAGRIPAPTMQGSVGHWQVRPCWLCPLVLLSWDKGHLQESTVLGVWTRQKGVDTAVILSLSRTWEEQNTGRKGESGKPASGERRWAKGAL